MPMTCSWHHCGELAAGCSATSLWMNPETVDGHPVRHWKRWRSLLTKRPSLSKMPTSTPMLKQYRQLKARYPDALLLYRLGDFYELFEGDAETVARQLGLVLTSRRFAKGLRLPMCGIPHHRLTGDLARLIRLGHKVAIVEQLEDARKTKRLVKRDVVRIITPGTVIELSRAASPGVDDTRGGSRRASASDSRG